MSKDVIKRVTGCLEREPSEQTRTARASLAAAALLVECARVDGHVSDAETERVAEAVKDFFHLEDDIADMLIKVATKRADEVWNDWLFTESVKRGFDADQRAELLRKLYEVAVANGIPQQHERAFLERIARELGVPREILDECCGESK